MLTADRNTPYKNGELIEPPVAGGSEIFAGAIVVANGTGYAAKGTTATGLTYLGRSEEHVDNSGGADGDKTVRVRRRQAFKWNNSSGDAVTQASLGKTVYIEDDETVAASDGGSTRSAAGIMVQLDSDGVWVE